MKTILVTGSNGQLGYELQQLASSYPQYRFVFTDVTELDITRPEHVIEVIRQQKADYIINCAAYTDVNRAESDTERARLINATAAKNIGAAASLCGTRVIHISTDYVFNGRNFKPYTENDPIDPQSVYGKTKAEGEQLLMDTCPESVILRTAWLYSTHGNNFVKTMLKLGQERKELKVVFDQVGSPTYAADLATAIMEIVTHADKHTMPTGIYHFSNEGVCSWYDFALKIHQLGGIDQCRVLPVESDEFPTPAPRPHYSVLNKGKIKSVLGLSIPHWEESLLRFFAALKA